jgi:predicted Ser/Thr protein kinase
VKVCPVCAREYPDNTKFCAADGSGLRGKSASADLVGQVVADRYHIIKKLGEGGMGAVYLGEHVKMGRKSAIKVMAAQMSQDPDAISRFNREASNASRISHPNVCQIYDFGETTDGLIYLAMEFIEGQALKDVIETAGALHPARAASILKQAADALQAAHDLNIVHRDIKPDNIMVVQGKDGTDVVKVVDFGIARAVGGDETGQKVTKTGLVVGTPEYMSPEQLSGDKLDGRSDIYSLALVLYRMLTGTLPFEADSAQEVMIKRLTDDPLPLDQARPDLVFPAKLQLVMNVALARTPAERYQSAAEFGRDTADAVAGTGAPSTRVAPAHEGATQVMSPGEVQQATKHQPATKRPAQRTAAVAAAASAAPMLVAAKRSLLVPVLGGGGALALIVVVALFASGKLGGSAAGAARPDTGATQTFARPESSRGGTKVPGGMKQQNNRPVPRDTATHGTNPPPGGGSMAAQIEDSLNAGTRASQNNDNVTAKRLARWVYYRPEAEPKQKADAAQLFLISLGDADTAQILDWGHKGLQHASGSQRAIFENYVRSVGGTP